VLREIIEGALTRRETERTDRAGATLSAFYVKLDVPLFRILHSSAAYGRGLGGPPDSAYENEGVIGAFASYVVSMARARAS
jgi:hypothetical protein